MSVDEGGLSRTGPAVGMAGDGYAMGRSEATLLPMPMLVVFILRFGDRMHAAFTTAREHYGALSALLQDNLSGMKEIQVFSGETREKRRVRGQAQRHTLNRLKANKLEALWIPSIEVIAGAGTVIAAWFGGRALSIPTLLLFHESWLILSPPPYVVVGHTPAPGELSCL